MSSQPTTCMPPRPGCSSHITLDWSSRFPSSSTNIITCNSSSCSCSCSCSCSSSNSSFLYNTLVNVEIHVEKKRQLKVESQCKTVQYTLPISAAAAAAADADEAIHTILLLSQSTYDRRRTIFLPPSGNLTVLQPSSSSCDYCHCRFFSQVQSWMSDALRKMQILSPFAVSDLSPRIADIFLNSTKEAASRGHDPDQYFDLWVSV